MKVSIQITCVGVVSPGRQTFFIADKLGTEQSSWRIMKKMNLKFASPLQLSRITIGLGLCKIIYDRA